MKRKVNLRTIFKVLGIAFMAVGMVLTVFEVGYRATRTQTVGTIMAVDPPEGDSSQEVLIQYWVDGIEYRQTLANTGNRAEEGTEVTIYYSVQNPNNIRWKQGRYQPVTFLVVGALWVFLSSSYGIQGYKGTAEDAMP